MTSAERESESSLSSASATGASLSLKWRIFWSLVLSSLFIYTLTVCPSVPPGDSGEMISSAYTLGVAHPPGYPLITVVGKLFSIIVPYGTPAWRINFLSAVCDAFASGLMYLTAYEFTGNLATASIAGVLFAFTPLIWTYALLAEVFALNNLLVSLLMYLAVRYCITHELKYARWGAFVMGCGFSNQHTISFFIIPFFPFILWHGRNQLKSPLVFASVLASGMAGLLWYVHLPMASYQQALNSWGDHRTIRGLLKHFLREEYGTFQLASNHHATHQWLLRIQLVLENFSWETFHIGAVLCAVGVLVALFSKRYRGVHYMLIVGYTFYMYMFNSLANLDVEDPLLLGVQARFWQQPYMIMFVWCAMGFEVIVSRVVPVVWSAYEYALELWQRSQPKPPAAGTRASKRSAALGLASGPLRVFGSASESRRPSDRAVLGVVLALAVVHVAYFYPLVDQSDNWVTEEFNRAILAPMGNDSIAILKSDHIEFPARYLQTVANFRSDVSSVNIDLIPYRWDRRNLGPHMLDVVFPGTQYAPGDMYGYSIGEFLDANLPRHRIYLCGMLPKWDETWHGKYVMWAYGLTGEFLPTNTSVDLRFFDDNLQAIKVLYNVPVHARGYPHIYHCWEYLIWRNYQESIKININFLEQMVQFHPNIAGLLSRNLAYALNLLVPFNATMRQERNDHARTWLAAPGIPHPQEDVDQMQAWLNEFEIPYETPGVIARYKARGEVPPRVPHHLAYGGLRPPSEDALRDMGVLPPKSVAELEEAAAKAKKADSPGSPDIAVGEVEGVHDSRHVLSFVLGVLAGCLSVILLAWQLGIDFSSRGQDAVHED